MLPSRLFYECSNDKLLERASHLFPTTNGGKKRSLTKQHGEELFAPPHVIPTFKTLAITAVDDYCRCPFGFYLKHVQKTSTVAPSGFELPQNKLGSLVHNVIATYSRQSRSVGLLESEIELITEIFYELSREAGLRSVGKLVELQQKEILCRLHDFILWSMSRIGEGWQVLYSEHQVENIIVPASNQKIALHGRIDRIEQHQETGRLAVIDFKLRNSDKAVNAQHKKKGEWVSLQLPLYSLAVGQSCKEAQGNSIELALLNLAKIDHERGYGLKMAAWSDEEFKAALDTAGLMLNRIYDGIFWPPNLDSNDSLEMLKNCAWREGLRNQGNLQHWSPVDNF